MENGTETKITRFCRVLRHNWSVIKPRPIWAILFLWTLRPPKHVKVDWIWEMLPVLEFWNAETTNMPSANDILESRAVSYLGSNADFPFMKAKTSINYSWHHITILPWNKFRGLYIKLQSECNRKENKNFRKIREIKYGQQVHIIIKTITKTSR